MIKERNLAIILTLVYFSIIALLFAIKEIAVVLILVFISASVLNWFVGGLVKYIKNLKVSIALALTLYGLFIVFSFMLVIPAVVNEFGSFYSTMMKGDVEQLREFFGDDRLFEVFKGFVENIRPKIDEYVNEVLTNLAKSAPTFGMIVFFAILGTAYSLIYLDHVKSIPAMLYPKRIHPVIMPFINELFANLMRFIQAVFFTAALTGIMFFTIFKIMGLKYSITVGVWAFATNFLPIVGVLFEYIPVFLFSLSLGFKGVLIMTTATILIHAAAFVIFLHMMKGYTKINPVEMLFFILVLWRIYGVMGIFVAVPLTIFIAVFWKHFVLPMFEGGMPS